MSLRYVLKQVEKLTALTRLVSFLTIEKRRLLMKAFIESQFNYSPLVWMFHSRKLHNKINKIHERSLRIVYNDDSSSFEELPSKDNSVSIHHRNIQSLAIEMYKSRHISNKEYPSQYENTTRFCIART